MFLTFDNNAKYVNYVVNFNAYYVNNNNNSNNL